MEEKKNLLLGLFTTGSSILANITIDDITKVLSLLGTIVGIIWIVISARMARRREKREIEEYLLRTGEIKKSLIINSGDKNVT